MAKTDLTQQHCAPIASEAAGLEGQDIASLLNQVPDWSHKQNTIERTFNHADYYHTMAFVNAVASIAHNEDHHPDLIVKYNRCTVIYTTHSVNGLSLNDFICAAKIDALNIR